MHESRREFLKQAGAVTVAAGLAAGRVMGANETVRLGVIGTGNRGGQLIDALRPH